VQPHASELLVCQANLVGSSDVDGLHLLLPFGSAEAVGLVGACQAPADQGAKEGLRYSFHARCLAHLEGEERQAV
jgi:hypothetical protein